MLHTHRFGPDDGPLVLALHGLTGHGRRWTTLADDLPQARILAPDLRGHGRSTWAPPWNLDTVVADVAELLDAPAVVVGHSFGGEVAVNLAHRHPDLVSALVLLDPAIELDPTRAGQAATDIVEHPDYADVDEARGQKRVEAWGELAPEFLEAEIAEHLVPTRDGRVGWRLSVPAIATEYGELARPAVLPMPGTPTVLVRATQVQPPYTSDEVVARFAAHLGDRFTFVEYDCDHMVPFARPREVAELVRGLI